MNYIAVSLSTFRTRLYYILLIDNLSKTIVLSLREPLSFSKAGAKLLLFFELTKSYALFFELSS